MLTPFDFKDYEFNNNEKIEDIFRTSPVHCGQARRRTTSRPRRTTTARRRQGEEVQAVAVAAAAMVAAAVSNKVG